jgi:hypothetical protein
LLGAGLVPHPRQRELLELIQIWQTVVGACGRRFGKTSAAAAGALHNLLLVPELDAMVKRGERRYALSVANSLVQARIFVGLARAMVLASPALRDLLVSETADELTFTNDRILAAFPCSARSGRGWAVSFLVIDEMAHALSEEEAGPQTQQRIWASMVPSVAQFGANGRVVAISTPLGTGGLFSELFAKARNGELPGAAAFHAKTSDNPLIDAAFLQAQEVALGSDDFRQEYEAEFLSGGAAFFEADRLAEVVADRQELPREAGTDWKAALDPSFAKDATGLAIVGRDPEDRGRLVLGWAGRWLPPRQHRRRRRSREEQEAVTDEILDAVATVLERYGLRECVSDQHLPGYVTSEMEKRGIRVRIDAWTAASRTEILQALRARVYARTLELYDPDGVPLLAELRRLRTRYRAGSSAVEIVRQGDSHGDVALAVAAASWQHDRYGFGSSVARFRAPTAIIVPFATDRPSLSDLGITEYNPREATR